MWKVCERLFGRFGEMKIIHLQLSSSDKGLVFIGVPWGRRFKKPRTPIVGGK